MTQTIKPKAEARLALNAETAADLMTPNPVSIRGVATVREAIVLLTDKGISAAPVIDEAGRPVGVLSRSDIVVHDRETLHYLEAPPEFYSREELTIESGERLPSGFQVEKPEATRVNEIMTPVVFAVSPQTAARRVVEDMVAWKVHRLFVVDEDGVLVGVISAIDVLRRLW
jgi:CBS domain-containing protein